MKVKTVLILFCVLTSLGFAQSITLIQNNAISGKSGLGIGFDPVSQKVIRSSYGNPPVIDYLNKDTLAVEGTLATGSATYGDLAGFGMGVGPDGSVVILDHVEVDSSNGLIRWTDYTDTAPGLCTAASSVPFPRYATILGSGTDQVFVCAGSGTGGALNVLTTTDGNTWSIAYSVGNPSLDPPEPGGQRGSAAYLGSGTTEYPELIFGCDAHAGATLNGIHVHKFVGSAYEYQGDMNPTSADNSDAILGIAVDPGFEATETVDGEAPVLLALGAHASDDHKTALYMFDLRTMSEMAVVSFTGASADIGYYGAIGLDQLNNRVYFTFRNSGDSTLGYADYTPPATEYLSAANNNWQLYE